MRLFLFILGIVAICALLVMGVDLAAEKTGAHKKASIQHAQGFINRENMDVLSLTCNDADNDGDGYIPCTFIMQDKTIQMFECDGFRLLGGSDYCEAHNEIALTQE